jgi:hypothetical protein
MMLTDTEPVESDLIREGDLFDEVAQPQGGRDSGLSKDALAALGDCE